MVRNPVEAWPTLKSATFTYAGRRRKSVLLPLSFSLSLSLSLSLCSTSHPSLLVKLLPAFNSLKRNYIFVLMATVRLIKHWHEISRFANLTTIVFIHSHGARENAFMFWKPIDFSRLVICVITETRLREFIFFTNIYKYYNTYAKFQFFFL